MIEHERLSGQVCMLKWDSLKRYKIDRPWGTNCLYEDDSMVACENLMHDVKTLSND